MKVLLDECLSKKLKFEIAADLVKTVPEAGWAGKRNGEPLKLAEENSGVILTNGSKYGVSTEFEEARSGVHYFDS